MRRVGILVGFMAKKFHEMGICQKYSDEYKYYGEAAAYHDIGKAEVPKSIITKPGKLTEEETLIMRQHPVFARRMLHRINESSGSGIPKHLAQLTANSAVYHHEWWNGKGYPYGIGSEDIPLIARVTSICDAYDAITSDRIYRKAHTRHYACDELEKNAGTQFDPALTSVFLDNEAELTVFIKRISCL